MTKLHLRAACIECGHLQWTQPLDTVTCEVCGSEWLQGHYDYATFKRELLRGLPGRPNNLWRYHDVLPIVDAAHPDLVVAGGTPLRPSWRYAAALGGLQVHLKDERLQSTGSFKDRQAAVSAAAMLEAGIRECVIASTGNAAVAYAAACARAGIKLWVFMTSLVPQAKMREAALFGAEVIKVSGTYEQAKQIAADFAERRRLFYDRGARSLPARESFKTIAYEIVEQLGWRAPDWYFQSVSGGLGPLGVYRGFEELYEMGLIDRVPALALIQAEGCSPMVQAFKAGRDVAVPITPETRIAILSTGDPGKAYTQLWKKIQHSGGTFESVSDKEAWTAMQTLARTEGMAVEPATAVAFAGLEKLARRGEINRDDLIVVNCTGHTFPVEKHVLGDQWHVDIDLASESQPVLRDGLLAALDRLDENVTTVLTIDDNADDALLIRRLLEAKKSYRVFHAPDGQAGLTEARQRLPDLVVLDLTMPNLDGFSVLEELKRDERTRQIPVIVVTARDITEAERQRLNGHVKAFYQKAALSPRAFVDQVVRVLDVKTGREEEHYG